MLRSIFRDQKGHLGWLILLFLGAIAFTASPGFSQGTKPFPPIPFLYWATLGNAFLHQLFVLICWRLELHHQAISPLFGGRGFQLYLILFFTLLGFRPLLITLLSVANRGTCSHPLLQIMALIFLPLTLALFYSLQKYFGFRRAAGADHFDPLARSLPLVRAGIFKYTDNGMYTIGFLLLWIPPMFLGSIAGIGAALFSHLYIWVHYFCVEQVDMGKIYGTPANE